MSFHGQGRAVQGSGAWPADPGDGGLPRSAAAPVIAKPSAQPCAAWRRAGPLACSLMAPAKPLAGWKTSTGGRPVPARSGAPLLPVALVNTHGPLAPSSAGLGRWPCEIRVGQPIAPPASRSRADLEATTASSANRPSTPCWSTLHLLFEVAATHHSTPTPAPHHPKPSLRRSGAAVITAGHRHRGEMDTAAASHHTAHQQSPGPCDRCW